MSPRRAAKVLKSHNKWRRGADIPMGNPKELGMAIETAIRLMEKCSQTTNWTEIAEGLYFSLNNDGVSFNNPLSKMMAKNTSNKYERAKGMTK